MRVTPPAPLLLYLRELPVVVAIVRAVDDLGSQNTHYGGGGVRFLDFFVHETCTFKILSSLEKEFELFKAYVKPR